MEVNIYRKQPVFTTVKGREIKILEKINNDPMDLHIAADFIARTASDKELDEDIYILAEAD